MPTQNFSDEKIHNLLSFSYTDPRKTTLCMGGNINQIFNYDIHQNVVVAKADTTQVAGLGGLVHRGGLEGQRTRRTHTS